MIIESRTVKPRATGNIRGLWRERYGDQEVQVQVDPGRERVDTEFRVFMERRLGPQLGDLRKQDFRLSREGAETLRDALTAALGWEADE